MQAGAAGLATAALASAGAESAHGQNAAGIPLRPLGRTGQSVTMICLGGYHSSVHPNENDSIRLIQRAVDEGITFLDNAWDYHNGAAEERMGKAISQGNRRDKVFLMTKCCGRTAKDAQSHLEDSLRRLRTDHLDLWQFHEIVYDNDPDWIFAKRRRDRIRPQGQGRRENPLSRLHRPQRPRHPSEDARASPTRGPRSRCP